MAKRLESYTFNQLHCRDVLVADQIRDPTAKVALMTLCVALGLGLGQSVGWW